MPPRQKYKEKASHKHKFVVPVKMTTKSGEKYTDGGLDPEEVDERDPNHVDEGSGGSDNDESGSGEDADIVQM